MRRADTSAAYQALTLTTALALALAPTLTLTRREQLNSSLNLPPQLRPYDRGALTNALAFCGCTVGCLQPQPRGAASAAASNLGRGPPTRATAPLAAYPPTAPLAAYPAADLHLLADRPPAGPARSPARAAAARAAARAALGGVPPLSLAAAAPDGALAPAAECALELGGRARSDGGSLA